MSLAPCLYRGDHKIRPGHMHGPGQCPPAPGKRGDRGHSLYAAKARVMGEIKFDDRGAAVAGVGGNQAKSHRQGKKAAKTKGEAKS